MVIHARPIDTASFEPFGRRAGDEAATLSINDGRGRRHDLFRFAGRSVAVALVDVVPSPWPVAVGVFERHPRSEQLFVPLARSRALVVVAPDAHDTGGPDLERAEAFIADAAFPFVYRAGVWHAPLYAVDGPGSFVMGVAENGAADDCELSAPVPSLAVIRSSRDTGIKGSRDQMRSGRS